MSKKAIVYWSGTGNTEQMAKAIAEGAGGNAELITADAFNADEVNAYDVIAFGCPSMGAEVLEESDFQPMWDAVKSKLNGKRIALFGSYGWGDGEWMRNWEDECKSANAVLVCDYVICQDAPDNEALIACRNLGASL